MRNGLSIVTVALTLTYPASARAQPPAATLDQLGAMVVKGELVLVQDQTGTSVRGTIVDVRSDRLVIDAKDGARTWFSDDLREVRRPTKDSVLNGAIIGAAVGGGLSALIYLDNECRGDPDCAKAVAVYSVIGAAVGAGIDALLHTNQLLYRRAIGRASWRIAPAYSVEKRRVGIQTSIGN